MSFSHNFIEVTPSDVATLPEYDRLQIMNDLANADNLAFRSNAINNYLRPFLKGVGMVGGALGGAAVGAPTGPGALFTGGLGAAGGNVLGDNAADAIAQLAGVPRAKGSIIDEIGYQAGNFAEGAALEAGGQAFNAALPFMAKVASPIASKSAELGLKALRSGEKVPAMVAHALGDSKFLEVFSRSPFFRKGLESVAKNPEKAASPVFRRMINQIGGRDAVTRLENLMKTGSANTNGKVVFYNTKNEAKGVMQKVGAKLTATKQSETADITAKSSFEATKPFGKAFTAYSGKPDEAINQLLKAKQGYVPAAVYKEGIGDIDFVWGEAGKAGTKEGSGLAHIIRRRNEEGLDGWGFVRKIPEIIKKGKVDYRAKSPGRVYIVDDNNEIAIRLTWDSEDKKWLVSAYVKKN